MVLSRAQDLVSDAFVVDLVAQVKRSEMDQEGVCVSQLVCEKQSPRFLWNPQSASLCKAAGFHDFCSISFLVSIDFATIYYSSISSASKLRSFFLQVVLTVQVARNLLSVTRCPLCPRGQGISIY